MTQAGRLLGNSDARAVLFLAVWPFVFFFPITLGQGLWLGADTIRTYFPLAVELSRALSQARLPLWTTGIYTGFPLLADGQIGALYPMNLLLYRLLPAHLALPYGMLLHLAWAACGMYALARAWRIGPAGALLAGLVFSFSGFFFTRLMHTPIILTGAWLPWLIFLQDRFRQAQSERRSAAAIWFFLGVLALAAQFLSGFPQIAFLNSLAFVVIGFCGRLFWNASNAESAPVNSGGVKALAGEIDFKIAKPPEGSTPRGAAPNLVARPYLVAAMEVLRAAGWAVLPVILGAGVAAIQLLPTGELASYSLRGSATSQSFVTSYSLPPAFLSQFVFPFAQGEPSEANNEYLAYFGFAPLALALLAPFLKRDRRTIFLSLFALAALSLALGELNPAYALLYRLPGFSLFRVPARYLYLFVFAAALLAAMSLDELARRLQSNNCAVRCGVPIALMVVIVVALGYTQPLEFWMRAWQILPWLFALAMGAVLWLARTRKIARGTLAASLLGLGLIDLSCYAPVFLGTIAPIVPAANIVALPRSLQALGTPQPAGRFFTDESVFPSQPALRASLFPNTSLIYGAESVQAYSSLALGRHEAYLIDPSPVMLNAANVQYFLVPLEPRAQTKAATPYRALYLDLVDNPPAISSTAAMAMLVTSFTEQAAGIAEGTPVGEINVKYSDGRTDTFALRVGIETADWDIERKGTPNAARVAHSFPGYWRSLGRPFEGHTYSARFEIAPPGQTRDIIGISADARVPDARLTIESVSLIDGQGRAVSLAHLAHKNNFALAFLSDTVAAWENLDVLPRAFVVHGAQVVDDNDAFARLKEQRVDVGRVVLLSDDTTPRARTLQDSLGVSAAHDAVEIVQSEPERVNLSVTTDRASHLVLADSWYPGWNAFVDGKPSPIYRADFLFRAVPLERGQHSVVFEYQPMSFWLGAAVGATSLLVAASISIFLRRRFAGDS